MKAIDRLYQYFDSKGIKPTRFEKDFGLSNGYFGKQLGRKADIGSSILEIIIDNCPDIDIEWLITGRGHMISAKRPAEDIGPMAIDQGSGRAGPSHCERCQMKDEINEGLRQQIKGNNQQIAVLNKLVKKYEDQDRPKVDGQKRKAAS
jgi:hypothetical protein